MEKFIPDVYAQSVYSINYKKLKKAGIKCLCFDLDNTLAPYSEDVPTSEVKELFHMLSNDFKLIIISNTGKKRLTPFKEILNVDVAYSSMKPLKRKFKKIMKLFDYKPEEIAIIGDQLITDILGGNRVGWMTIFVNNMSDKEPVWTKFNRFFEGKILKRFHKKGLLEKGEYYE